LVHQIVKLFFIKPGEYRDGKRLHVTHNHNNNNNPNPNNDNSVENKIISQQQLDSLLTEGGQAELI